MKKIKNKLIVSDFDGTLLTSENTVPEKVRSAISEYVECGGIFAVCTGRMLRSILPRVRELGLKGLVVAYQGTVIAEIESGKILRRNCIRCSDVAEVCKYLEELGQCINIYSNEVFYTNVPKGHMFLNIYEERTGVEAEVVGQSLSVYVLNNGLDCQKITCMVMPKDRDKLYEKLLEKFGNRFDVTCSASSLVEVSPIEDNKGAALKYIAEYFDIPLSSTVSIGDNLNDLTMIRTAGTGVAVGNAVQTLKDAADYVTVTNDECAVAEIIKKFGFEEYYV